MEYRMNDGEVIEVSWICCNCRHSQAVEALEGDDLHLECEKCPYELGSIDTSNDDWGSEFEQLKEKHERFMDKPFKSVRDSVDSTSLGAFKTVVAFALLCSIVSAWFLGNAWVAPLVFIGVSLSGAYLSPIVSVEYVLRRSDYNVSREEIKEIARHGHAFMAPKSD